MALDEQVEESPRGIDAADMNGFEILEMSDGVKVHTDSKLSKAFGT